MNTISRAIIAAGLVGVLAIVAIVLWGPRTPSLSGSGSGAAVPIAQPITPSTWPYSQLAILRTQRLSIDVLPASAETITSSPALVPASARRLGDVDGTTVFIAVNTVGEVCLVYTQGATTSGSACSTGGHRVPPGTGVIGGGAGDWMVDIFVDGTPSAADSTGKKQLSLNTWVENAKSVTPYARPAFAGDAAAFPAVAPFDSFAILRRAATSADDVPAAWKDAAGSLEQIDLTTLRYAGARFHARVWAAVDLGGHPCVIVETDDGLRGSSCATGGVHGPGKQAASVGVNSVFVDLLTDGEPDDPDVVGATKLAPNVWVSRGQ